MSKRLRAVITLVGLTLSMFRGELLEAGEAPQSAPEKIRVTILGQVKDPGSKVLPAGATLDQLFAAAGGLPGDSDLDPDEGWPPVGCKVSRIRLGGEKLTYRVRINIDPKTRVITTDKQRPFVILSGDLITLTKPEA